MPDLDRIAADLAEIGMSAYEAKAYLALVAGGAPLTGYEVAKRSGVPRSTVYETLAKLVAREAAFEVRSESETTIYVALPPDTLLRRVRRQFEDNLDRLSGSLAAVTEPPVSHLVHNLEGRSAVLARAADVIHASTRELHVSIWADDLDDLADHLRMAERRGVDISLIRFGESTTEIGHTFDHLFASSDDVLARVGCRLLIVASDRQSVLIGGSVGASMWAMYSDDPAVVLVAVEFVRHDIGFQVLVDEVGTTHVEEIFQSSADLVRLRRGGQAPGLARRAAAG